MFPIPRKQEELTMSAANILVIDDDPQIRTMLRFMLENVGYEVRDAADGKAGMSLFREKPADLVITDIIMPEKEGIETILELRRDFPSAKIIAMSGGGRLGPEQYLESAKNLGAQRILTKPFSKENVLEAVRNLLA